MNDSDSFSQQILQNGSAINEQHYLSAGYSDHIMTLGNRTEMDMYPLKWQLLQEGEGHLLPRTIERQNQESLTKHFNKR